MFKMQQNGMYKTGGMMINYVALLSTVTICETTDSMQSP